MEDEINFKPKGTEISNNFTLSNRNNIKNKSENQNNKPKISENPDFHNYNNTKHSEETYNKQTLKFLPTNSNNNNPTIENINSNLSSNKYNNLNESNLSSNRENEFNNNLENFNNILENQNNYIKYENSPSHLKNLFVIEELILAFNKFEDNNNKKEIIKGILQHLSNK